MEHDETFHPVIGPAAEARQLHVVPHRFDERVSGEESTAPFVLWDIGFGAGANAIAALEAIERLAPSRPVEFHSFDRSLAAIEFALKHAEALSYLNHREPLLRALLRDRRVSWGPVTWQLHEADICAPTALATVPGPDSILFDPYSPAANPESWSLEVFQSLRARANEGCLLSSYSRSTAVRSTLLLAGWFVGHGVGIADKNETTLAATRLEDLVAPLDDRWLSRLARSTARGPLLAPGNVFPGDPLALIQRHPQFQHRR